MTEDIKQLIEKIQREGVNAAEEKAREIEEDTRRRASSIIEDAKREAEKVVTAAKKEASRMQESGNLALKQAGRDMLLSLKKEINAMLERLVVARLRESLAPQELARIIAALIKESPAQGKEGIIISLNKEDLEKLEKGFLNQLAAETRKGIALYPSEDIAAGFIISYDAGKSHFDFTDKSLAEYIGVYLKPKLEELLKTSGSADNQPDKSD